MKGQKRKGAGVDCVRFVAGVMDELYGMKHDEGIRMPYDTALHNRRGAISVVRFFVKRYEPITLRKENGEYVVQPGDVIVTKLGSNPGHVLIVGTEPNTVWNSIENAGVCKTGFGQMKRVLRVWRPRDRGLWQIS